MSFKIFRSLVIRAIRRALDDRRFALGMKLHEFFMGDMR